MVSKFNALLCLPFLALIINVHAADFDVTKYGAKPNGDIKEALMSAWKEACLGTEPAKIIIPKDEFMLSPVTLQGCNASSIEIEAQGTIKAPEDPAVFKDAGWQWFTVQYISHFTLSGGGVFDGQGGKMAWKQNDCNINKNCPRLAVNFVFNFVNHSTIRDITSKDSKNFNVQVLGCNNVTFQNFKVSCPGDSPNTDGIHIGRSSLINVIDSEIKTGDDCVSIGDGVTQVTVERVTCGPGHGFSVGSLGGNVEEEDVTGVTVKNCTMIGTQNGVRIKTWPSKPGRCQVSDIHFEDVIMEDVGNPIFIDQEYCPSNLCKLDAPSLVKISKVSIKNIRGTSSTNDVIRLICSKANPCDVEIGDVDLTYNGKEGPITSTCKNVKPTLVGKQNPPVCSNSTTGF